MLGLITNLSWRWRRQLIKPSELALDLFNYLAVRVLSAVPDCVDYNLVLGHLVVNNEIINDESSDCLFGCL